MAQRGGMALEASVVVFSDHQDLHAWWWKPTSCLPAHSRATIISLTPAASLYWTKFLGGNNYTQRRQRTQKITDAASQGTRSSERTLDWNQLASSPCPSSSLGSADWWHYHLKRCIWGKHTCSATEHILRNSRAMHWLKLLWCWVSNTETKTLLASQVLK